MNTILPIELYSAVQVRDLDRLATTAHNIPGYTLMTRAGEVLTNTAQTLWPGAQKIVVVCGGGNNAGDGFVAARLLAQTGKEVTVVLLSPPTQLKNDAKTAFDALKGTSARLANPVAVSLSKYDLIIDAVFGSGLDRPVEGEFREIIIAINCANKPVLSVDIPSGISADTGEVLGAAVRADATVTFMGLKRGLFTCAGPDYAGKLFFDALNVPPAIYNNFDCDVTRLHFEALQRLLPQRKKNSHKVDFGHVLVVGGNTGMMGAACLCATAALRSGAGLVSVATRPEHAPLIAVVRPEIMACGISGEKDLIKLIARANVIAIGCGLGQDKWAKSLLKTCLSTTLPLVVDADALNLLSLEKKASKRDNWILTPHPGEAAKLLKQSTRDIQKNRFAAIKTLAEKRGGTVLLKGLGTLVCGHKTEIGLCDLGNPAMATAGMGDVLTGIIAGLCAQGLQMLDAARLGVCLHARAGDIAADGKSRGLLASDLFEPLRDLINS